MGIRTFIAIDLENEETLENIQSFTNRLQMNQPKMKVVKPENIHLTVKFLGNIKESLAPKIYEILETKVNQKLLQGEKYIYKLNHVGQFRKYSIIWLGMEGDIDFLQNIKDTIEESLNQRLNLKKDKRRKFKPHITIARLKKKRIDYKTFDSFKNIIETHRNENFGDFIVDKVKLKKSDLTPKGPIYTDYTKEGFK
ncbi:MAG: RNA 2',3'-cyclic phosphodiesterase [Promethearchaeota archaeon]|nr:MAG: RNA 2',3'-cyclic phosphodiesterase [Candidatus Lokiarchaeota archaeon]